MKSSNGAVAEIRISMSADQAERMISTSQTSGLFGPAPTTFARGRRWATEAGDA